MLCDYKGKLKTESILDNIKEVVLKFLALTIVNKVVFLSLRDRN